MLKAALVSVGLLTPAFAVAQGPTPLLDYALAQTFEPDPRELGYDRELLAVQHEMERNPPPATDCAQTLGAARFAAVYDDLGSAHSNLGDYASALDAYQRALTCTPRATYRRAAVAQQQLRLDRYLEARATAEQDIDDEEGSLNRILAQLDFIEEHWDDAARRLRTAVASLSDNEHAAYWQCILWLAQRRGGVTHPTLVSHEPPEHWPKAILDHLTGALTETELATQVGKERDHNRRREILAEALYYTGERRLADGDTEDGRRYLAEVINLKVHSFIEHHLALAELAKMRARS